MARLSVRANQVPALTLAGLDLWKESPQSIHDQIAVARDYHLSLFATGDAAKYLRERPPEFPQPRAVVAVPRNDSILHGKQLIDVVVTDSYDVTRVDYFVSGPGSAESWFATGTSSTYGWIATWNTSTVPNGSYTIHAKVNDTVGRSARTRPIEVHVENANRPGS
jgi:hypothetical protein